MINKLPYTLGTGVTATRDGLLFNRGDRCMSLSALVESYGTSREILGFKRLIPWHAAAKRLRYREGDPWCAVYDAGNSFIVCWPAYRELGSDLALHRLAAILCDDAEAFRVLHWCVTNQGGQKG